MSKTALAVSIIIGATLGKKYFSTFDSAEQKVSKLGAALEKNNRKMETTKSVIKYRNQLSSLRAKQTSLGRSSKRLDAGIAEVEKRYKSAKSAAKGYGFEIISIGKTQDKLMRQNKRILRQEKAIDGRRRAASKMGSLRGQMLGAVGAVWGLGKMVGGASKLAEAKIRLSTVINAKDTEAAVEKASKHASSYARNSLASEIEILDIQYALNSAGLDSLAAMIGSEVTAKVAKVTNGQAEAVGEIIGGIYNNFGKSLDGSTKDKLQKIGDILTKTQLKYQIRDFGQLGESFKEGAKAAIKYNVPLDQTAAVLGQLNSSMIMGSSAGTAMNAILRQMGKASEALGFDLVRNSNGQLDMIATLNNLSVAMEVFDDPDKKAAAIQEMFGDEGGAVALLISDMEKLNAGFIAVRDQSAGVVDKAYEKFLDSAPGKIARFNKNVGQLGTTFGATLLPAVSAVLEPLIELTGWAGTAMEEYPVIGQIIGSIAAGMITFGAGIAIVTAAQWAWNVAMMANPIGLLIVGIAAVSVAIWTLYKNWDVVMGGIISSVETAAKTVGDAWDWLTGDDEETPVNNGKENPSKAISGGKNAIAAGVALASVVILPVPPVLDGSSNAISGNRNAIAAGVALDPVVILPVPPVLDDSSNAISDNKNTIAAGAALTSVSDAPSPDVLNNLSKPPMVPAAQINQTNNNMITINQQPGQDANNLAKEISRQITIQQNGALYD